MKIFIILIMFLHFGTLIIISNNNLALSENKNLKVFGDLWVDWIGSVFKNVGSLTGNAVKMTWVSG